MNHLSDRGRFLLKDAAAGSLFDRIVDVVRSEWHPLMHRAGVTEADYEAIRGAFVYDGLFYDSAP